MFRCIVFKSSRYYSTSSSKKLLEILSDMPKSNSARIVEAQRQRQQIAKKSEKYGPSTVYLQVLGSGAKGAPNTLYLFTDQKRYMFNCGECTQRLAHEHKVKLSRLDHIFITSKTWTNIGGLPGLSLTLQDVGVPNITLHGPEGLDELYNATKRFVVMKDMNVTMAACCPSEDFEDNVMNVKYVLLGPLDNLLTPKALKTPVKKPKVGNSIDKEFDEFIHDETDYYNRSQKRLHNEKDKPKYKIGIDKGADSIKKKTEKVLHDFQKQSNCSVAYICTLKKRPGTLDLAKCVELGVKPGPMLGQLKNGHDVVLPDGNLVRSQDVKTPDDPGPVFIVLDVPDPSYLKESEFQAYFDNGENPPENIPSLIVHFTPPNVFHHPTYRSFITKFGPSTRHLVLNSQNACLGSEAVHRTQHKLHLLDPDIFPLLKDASVPAVWHATPPVPRTTSPLFIKGLEELKNKIALAQFQNIINLEGPCKGDGQIILDDSDTQVKLEVFAGRSLTMYHLRPNRQLDRSAEPKLHIQDYIQETMDVDGFVESLEQFRRLVDGIKYAKSDVTEYPKVVFLGTGSSIPSKTRNTSSIAVQIDEDRSMLMDCGEGTYGQLVRFYGPKKVNSFLRTLKAIYISHLHADHHIGLIGILQARRLVFEEVNDQEYVPVYLLAPGQLITWLNLYDHQFERIKGDYTLIANQSLLQNATAPNPELTAAVLAAIGVESIETCLVAHCPNAFGVAVQINQQYKLTYSGDTVPCEELVKLGENSTLLIHEATMEDELSQEARIKMHSTTTQAIEIGRQMNARYTILTHFSQRYARLPRLNANILNDNKTVGIAFDNMQVTMSDLALLPHMYAPLQLMFAEHCVEMELRAAHRQRGRDKRASSPNTPQAAKRPKEPTKTDSVEESLLLDSLRGICSPSYLSTISHGPEPVNESDSSSSPLAKKSCNDRDSASLSLKNNGPSDTSLRKSSPARDSKTIPKCKKPTNLSVTSNLTPTSPGGQYRAISKPKVTNTVRNLSIRKDTSYTVQSPNKSIVSQYKQRTTDKRSALADTKIPVVANKFSHNMRYKSGVLSANNRACRNIDAARKTVPVDTIEACKELGSKPTRIIESYNAQRTSTVMHSSVNGYKPQLEDIKSSFLLLHQDKHDVNKKLNESNKLHPSGKPSHNEELRRQKLLAVKQKFQSKEFWNESKYDKIEGLNWISW